MKLKIALGKREGFTDQGLPRLGTLTNPCKELAWASLVHNLSNHKETDDKGSVGFMVGGWFEGTRRVADALQGRTVIILDLDYAEPWDDVEGDLRRHLEGTAFTAHTTWSHSEYNSRWRVVIPLDRPVDAVEYPPLARKVCEPFIEWVDPASFKYNQLMYLPARKPGADCAAIVADGEPVHVTHTLAQYEDWRDWGEWPRNPIEGKAAAEHAKAKNPAEAPGIIGAFNRVYSVQHAILDFGLPYELSDGGVGDRYSYIYGDGNPGAIVYDNYFSGCFLYSNHTDDPAHGNNTAWDLVRIHQYGELDKDYDGPIGQAPSQKAMTAMAAKLPEVVAENAAEEGFEDISADSAENHAGNTADSAEIPTQDSQANGSEGSVGFSAIEAAIISKSALNVEMARDLVVDIAAAKLDPMEESSLVAMIAAKLEGVTKSDVQRQLKSAKDSIRGAGGGADIERIALNTVLADHFEDGLHLKRFAKKFWRFRAGMWRPFDDERCRGLVQTTLFDLREKAPTNRDRQILRDSLAEMKTSAAASSLWQMFVSLVAVQDLDDDDPLKLREPARAVVNCLNGEIHFNRKGQFKLTRHHPEYFLTTQIPMEYDPDADTTEWDNFCNNILFSDSLEPGEMKRHLEEVLGYVIQPWRDIPTIHMFRGEPEAGKTTILSILERMLGDSIVTRKFASYGGQNDHATAGLVGKLLLVDPDYSDGDQLPDGFLKTISEGGQLTVNPKGTDEFNFRVSLTPMILTNHWPSSRDYSGAMERRILAWNFRTVPHEVRDDRAKARLLSPSGLQGALKRFVEGFARLYERHWNGEGRQGWVIPDECVDAAETWREHRDVVLRFYKACVRPGPGSYNRSEAFEKFNEWRQKEGISGKWSQKGFNERFETMAKFTARDRRAYWDIDINVDFEE